MFEKRGLSDVIAFILTFSVIILSVSAVSVLGVQQLTETRDREQVNSAERSMIAFAANLDDVSRQGDNVRSGGIALQDGRLDLVDASVRLRITETPGGDETRSVEVNALRHRLTKSFGDVDITYENGAVFRHTLAGANEPRMQYYPTMRCAPDKRVAIVTLVALNGSVNVGAGSPTFSVGPQDAGGQEAPVEDLEQAVQLAGRLNESESEVVYSDMSDATGKTVHIDVSGTTNTAGWESYLLNETNWNESTATGYQASCGDDSLSGVDDDLNTVVVRTVTVDITIVG
jgi:hypothetical protein